MVYVNYFRGKSGNPLIKTLIVTKGLKFFGKNFIQINYVWKVLSNEASTFLSRVYFFILSNCVIFICVYSPVGFY